MSLSSTSAKRPGIEPGQGFVEALYVHVPFCRPICPFCAFAVHGDKPELHQPYLEALASEIVSQSQQYADLTTTIRSIYIGGGTPSRLTPLEMEFLLGTLRKYFTFASDVEIALELNPEDVTRNFVDDLRSLGINRMSLGLQSLDESTLKALGRGHTATQGKEAAELLLAHGPPNINLDLMFGTPGIPADTVHGNLHTLLAWAPAHVSLYGLDVEPGTLFGRDRKVHTWVDTHVEERNDTYLWSSEVLSNAGYRHYEVSNFCRPGLEGRQNIIVWNGGNYLGFGPGAHAHVNGRRSANVRHLKSYIARAQAGESLGAFEEETSETQRANEFLMLALRTDIGLDIKVWAHRYGVPWGPHRAGIARRLVDAGQAMIQGDRLILTPRGFLVADEIAGALAAEAAIS